MNKNIFFRLLAVTAGIKHNMMTKEQKTMGMPSAKFLRTLCAECE